MLHLFVAHSLPVFPITGCLLLSISTPIVLSRPDVSIPEGFDKTANPSAIDEAERIGSQKKVVAFSDSPTEWLSRQLRLDNNGNEIVTG